MTKKKNKITNNVVCKGVARVFKYNAGIDAVVDGNSVQMAFVKDYKGERKTMLEYTWSNKDKNGNLIQRGIKVSGHGEYGVPTLKEYDVYVALQRIFIDKKTQNGMCTLLPDNYDDDYLIIEFNITELANQMGYNTPSSKTRDNLKKSIDILLATTIYSIHNGGIYDIKEKKYITNSSYGVHLIESMESIDITDSKDSSKNINYTRLRLSRFTYEQIVNDYKLFYDKSKYNRTKNLLAKKIYHLALQWKGDNKFSYANIDTLVERIPMVNCEAKYRKREIKSALKALNDNEIVNIKYDDQNPNKVYFLFSDDNIKPVDKKYKTFKEIQQRYHELGFSDNEIDEYLDIEKIRYIQALLRYMDNKKNIKDSKKYFVKCYKKPIEIPSIYFGD